MKVCRLVQKLVLVLAVIPISPTGCAGRRAVTRGGDMVELHLKNRGLAARDVAAKIQKDLTLKKAYGYTKPYVPILTPPEVRLVWIPDHMADGTDDAMVGGHWVYLKIRDSQFYIQGQPVEPLKKEVVPFVESVEPILEKPGEKGSESGEGGKAD